MRLHISLCLALFAALCAPRSAAAETVWFVVAEIQPHRGESFLLPLSDPEDIAQARSLIAQGPGGTVGSIASLRIAAGADGLNRDVRRPGTPLWSWHVVGFDGFADFAIELCDGWPGFIEQDVAAFIANTGGQVCFWGYTVVEELAQAPQLAVSEALDGAWYNPATSGQGLFLDVMPAQGIVFGGWFTFERGSGSAQDPRHRWLTVQGPYQGSEAALAITLTTGGAFDAPDPVLRDSIGTLQLRFTDCNHAVATYRFDDGLQGEIPLERAAGACAR